jgi:hypothetical protein
MAHHIYHHHQPRIALGLICLALQAGCLSAPVAPAPPIPVPQTIVVAPAVSYWQGAIHQCVLAQSNIGILVDIRQPGQEPLAANEWLLSGADPGSRDAYDLGTDTLKLIVHPDSPLTGLTSQQTAGIYTGFIRTWGEVDSNLPEEQRSRAIHYYSYPAADELAQLFSSSILNGEQPNLRTVEAPDPTAVIRAVSADPDGIGYIPARWMTSTVKAITLDFTPTFQLSLSVGAPPDSAGQTFIACLQKAAVK